ncbi:MAG TPA: 2-hydroxychromene-2-carboxylate isomerase [Polaromonas sp.]|uniref:2-hydroxychromene-2-carboxylate isomerase n=1 Tax=Polaromonas sp. UBA4122 TaxID=1947074 RepID=UPI000EC8F5BA|nr:2-hydroxychromene-2-carboxylate isomerase [Polaromonas sp. UBA4122]HAL36882.1 2-hydroxychromene-2-carboxylate isomerase [Polaromonas sp.]
MIEFFFDCSSPWTYLAFRNLQPLAAELKEPISWRPVLVGGIFNSVNKGIYTAREDMNSPKNRYLLKDVQDSAREAGLNIVFPPKVFPVNSVKAMRGCLWIAQDAQAPDHYLAFVEATFAAYFSREEDISQDEVLAALCRQVGINTEAFFAGISRPDIKEQLKANTDEAIRRGAFGSPTFYVGDDMYFGNDRLPLVRSAVLHARQ